MDKLNVAVQEATMEAGEEGSSKSDTIRMLDAEIEELQSKVLELNKMRSRRLIEIDDYNNESKAAMEKIDELFAQRDEIEATIGNNTLSNAFKIMVDEFLEEAAEQAEFDKDIFVQLISVIHIVDRNNIIFEFKDGTKARADTGAQQVA